MTALGDFDVSALKARIAELEAALAGARNAALDEAIAVCMDERGPAPKFTFHDQTEAGWFDGAQACADAIRALKGGGRNESH